jgi:uncharacterized protein YkwD
MGPTCTLGPRRGFVPPGVGTRTRLCIAALVAVLTAGLAASATSTASAASVVGNCTIPAGARPVSPSLEFQVVGLVNAYRATLGLTQLQISPSLTAASEWKASHMATYQYMTHDDPAEGPPFNNPARNWDDRVLTCGYPLNGGIVFAGENIAFGQPTPSAVVGSITDPFETSWLSSPMHKANIENTMWRSTGAGAAQGANGLMYWSQDFGNFVDSAAGSNFAVTMRSMSGHATKHGVVLHWRTASEIDTAGFRVYRVMHGTRIRVSHRLLPALGRGGGGHSYTFRDRHVPAGKRTLTYYLQSIDLDATKTWHGPARVARR